MNKQNNHRRLGVALGAAGIGLGVVIEAASAQLGLVDVNSLLRLLDIADLNPFF